MSYTSWEMPSSDRVDQIEAMTPKRIPTLSEGHFVGLIEQIDIPVDEGGHELTDKFDIIIRVIESGNKEHIGSLLLYTHFIKNKKGAIIPVAYRWLAALDADLNKGGSWHPTKLIMTKFKCKVEYRGKYWNFVEPEFLEKKKEFDFNN